MFSSSSRGAFRTCFDELITSIGRPPRRTRAWRCRDWTGGSRSPLRRRFHINYAKYDKPVSTSESRLQGRIDEVFHSWPDPYPRLDKLKGSMSCSEYVRRYENIKTDETIEQDLAILNGRVRSSRLAGSKLIFFDIYEDGTKVQVLCNLKFLPDVTPGQFKEFYRALRRGDSVSVTGHPHRTSRNELTILATKLPRLLSPCLHDIPIDTAEHETSPYPRHVQFLTDQNSADTIRIRSEIIQCIRKFFLDRSFMEIDTPIIAGEAGGAAARPFYTTAEEFSDKEKPLSLRISPELWLKRLIVGGFDKVFEIGPSFRNEGLDKTHNPEFTTCEFYHTYVSLEELMAITEALFSDLARHIDAFRKERNLSLQIPGVDVSSPFRRLDFIPSIEKAIGRPLPDLTAPKAADEVKELYEILSLPLPDQPTLPRLLDKLCATYVEPQCHSPTFILYPPECLSPLAKSFTHPTCNQQVAARCELFIEGREYVNAYEEENSPFEQRRKFRAQSLNSAVTKEAGDKIDETYLQALEWGLPPTGGWGCGVDRLVMLFGCKNKIAEVLPFGNLRQVTRRAE